LANILGIASIKIAVALSLLNWEVQTKPTRAAPQFP
jgi:hypothetical protein